MLRPWPAGGASTVLQVRVLEASCPKASHELGFLNLVSETKLRQQWAANELRRSLGVMISISSHIKPRFGS